MAERDAPQQPIPERPHAPGAPKKNPYGESEAVEKPEGGRTKYDKPAEGADDFAIDEERDKRIRGNEAPDD
ncbi:hypothetical protein MWU52_02975 [Jannaschia sp. S6380]|uniref:hypothetical protein n=1 Tax=Jannaschia sp. S6380 TaxID=2926408 RepID=UPI001FF3D8C5|nr:hypothetical protein [Jannaschia sp. S6380]MCK0166507.1 hypothetical protein [Jannaschia sp. S6380]